MKGLTNRLSNGLRRGCRFLASVALVPIMALQMVAPFALHGQDDAAPQPGTVDATVASTQSAPTVGPAPADDAVPVLLPRSMRPTYHLFAAYGVAWVLILVYVVSVGRRLRSLESEVQRLNG